MTRGVSTSLTTKLPARLRRGVAWNVDRRCKAVREYAALVFELSQALGGFDQLPPQKQWIIEDAAFWHYRLRENRAALLSGRPPTLTPGEHQNGSSTLKGHLKDLGLERVAANMPTLRDFLAGRAA